MRINTISNIVYKSFLSSLFIVGLGKGFMWLRGAKDLVDVLSMLGLW